MDELVIKARAGDSAALEKIINQICHTILDPETDRSYLEIWALDKAQYLSEWEAEDIVARMREWIWRIVMDEAKYPNMKFSEVSKLAWHRLVQVVITQSTREKTKKRTGTMVEFDGIMLNHLYEEPTSKTILFERDVEILCSHLTPIQKFIVEQIVYHDKKLIEIAEMLCDMQDKKWYPELVRNQLKKVRKAMVSLNTIPFERAAIL